MMQNKLCIDYVCCSLLFYIKINVIIDLGGGNPIQQQEYRPQMKILWSVKTVIIKLTSKCGAIKYGIFLHSDTSVWWCMWQNVRPEAN